MINTGSCRPALPDGKRPADLRWSVIASAIIMHNDSSVSDNNANRDNGHEMPSVRK